MNPSRLAMGVSTRSLDTTVRTCAVYRRGAALLVTITLILLSGCGGAAESTTSSPPPTTDGAAEYDPLTEGVLLPGRYEADADPAVSFEIPPDDPDTAGGFWSGLVDQEAGYLGAEWTPASGDPSARWGIFFDEITSESSLDGVLAALESDDGLEATAEPVDVELAGTTGVGIDVLVSNGDVICDFGAGQEVTFCTYVDLLARPVPAGFRMRLFVIQVAGTIQAITIQGPSDRFEAFFPVAADLLATVAYAGPSEGPDTQDDDDD